MMKNRNRLPEGHAPTEQRGAPVTTRAPVLSLSVDRPCGWSVLAASGEIDTACAGTLRSLLAVAGPNVVMDLREVTFMDASGLGVLATSGHIARRLGGEVRLVGSVATRCAGSLALTSLDRVLPIYDDLQEALVTDRPPRRSAASSVRVQTSATMRGVVLGVRPRLVASR